MIALGLIFGWLPVAWLATAAPCYTVEAEQITARDMARAALEFDALPAETPLGFSPQPGGRRIFTAADIRGLATRNGISSVASEPACFEWTTHRLERADILGALVETLGDRGARLELEDYSLFPAPAGKIVFPLANLNQQAPGAALWRGYVQYAGNRRFAIWAKVRVPSVFDVKTGDHVAVLVENGAAQLKLEGLAVSPGRKGQTVTVRNIRSGKLFSAEVIGKASVHVDAGATNEE